MQQDEHMYGDLESIFDAETFKLKILGENFNWNSIVDKNQVKYVSEHCDSLPRLTGSRRFCWCVFLGLIPSQIDVHLENDHLQWITQLALYRKQYYKKMEAVMQFKQRMEEHQQEMAELVSLRWATSYSTSASTSGGPDEENKQEDP